MLGDEEKGEQYFESYFIKLKEEQDWNKHGEIYI